MEGPRIRVQIAPGRSPRYVSVVLDQRSVKRRGRIVTLHSFGRDCLVARVKADRFRAECLLAYQYLRQAIEGKDREMVIAMFAPTLGTETLSLLAPGTEAPAVEAAEKPAKVAAIKHVARRIDLRSDPKVR